MPENLVLVTGAPGAGKTTLAVPLARELGFPLMSKDSIKEALDDTLAWQERDAAWSRLLGNATYDAMWRVAPYFDNLVLECNFYPRSAVQREKLASLSSRIVEVYCDCPAEEARRRFALRARSRHPVHVETRLSSERMMEWDRPLGLGPVLSADMTAPVDVPDLARRVKTALTSIGRHESSSVR